MQRTARGEEGKEERKKTGQSREEQGRARQGRAGQGRARQGKKGQERTCLFLPVLCCCYLRGFPASGARGSSPPEIILGSRCPSPCSNSTGNWSLSLHDPCMQAWELLASKPVATLGRRAPPRPTWRLFAQCLGKTAYAVLSSVGAVGRLGEYQQAMLSWLRPPPRRGAKVETRV